MGALHAGHASLIEIARKFSSEVVVSIFVNPLQFENPNDFSTYPKSIDTDVELATASGATKVWVPTFDEIYPNDPVLISSGEIGNLFEGVHRFGHFDGMLTVVKRLFDLVSPKYAIFGEKDFQQLSLVRQVAGDVEIVQSPTVRGDNGIALSSRNMRLSESEMESARVISEALFTAASQISVAEALLAMRAVLALQDAFKVEYADIVDEVNFSIADEMTPNPRAIIAGWINGVRLIDNMAMRVRV
jgi:pantoate--beta-alanine ligase